MISAIRGQSLSLQLASLELDKKGSENESCEAEIACRSDLQTASRQDAERALEKAKEAAEDAGFWSDVADVATVAVAVGGVVAAAGTGGSSLVVALAVTGAIGTAATQTKPGQELLKDELGMSDDAIMYTGYASMLLSVGAGFGAAASKEGGIAALRAAGTMTAGAGGTVDGVAHFGQKSAESRSVRATRDGKAADRGAEEAGARIDDSIERAKRSQARHDSNMSQIREAQQSSDATRMFLSQRG